MDPPSSRDDPTTSVLAPSTPTTPATPTTLSSSKRLSASTLDESEPLVTFSPDRLSKQTASGHRQSVHNIVSTSSSGHSRDSSVSDKINQFNTLAAKSNHLDRKTADAALKRAVVGREAAEDEVRRCREEVRTLRKEVDDAKVRERRVGERLETLMENYGRTKETHAHTQSLWEKEIRRMRKETFKSQSIILQLQEDLKSTRAAYKSVSESLEREKERSLSREQEALQTRYNLVGVKDQFEQTSSELHNALERIKTVEQEREAFKSLVPTEEDNASIAADGKPLLAPASHDDDDDEFASSGKTNHSGAAALSPVQTKSCAASEAEIEELTRLWQWEKQRADRAADQVEYLEAECRLRACLCMKKRSRSSIVGLLSPKRQKLSAAESLPPLADPSDHMILSEKATAIPPPNEDPAHALQLPTKKATSHKFETRGESRATVFLPDLGTFRTVSMEEADALSRSETRNVTGAQLPTGGACDSSVHNTTAPIQEQQMSKWYSRPPSTEPPSFSAQLGTPRSSLASLLDAPHYQQQSFQPGTTLGMPNTTSQIVDTRAKETTVEATLDFDHSQVERQQFHSHRVPLKPQDPNIDMAPPPPSTLKTSYSSRPHTITGFYSTTTTTIPLREEDAEPSMAEKLLALNRTPSRGKTDDGEGPSWDVNNPALTPTMTREQALAKIRERRGRAKSGADGTRTPHGYGTKGARAERRDLSAPAGRRSRIGS